MRWRARGEAAGEGCVAVHVELEKVEEGVADEGDRAVEFRLNTVLELERLACLVTYWEGRPLDLMRSVLEVFAGLSVKVGDKVTKLATSSPDHPCD